MRALRQPLIMSYIITGIVVGPSVLDLVQAREAFNSFSEIGITLLLFIIGLGMNAGVIKSLGRVSLVTASMILGLVGITGYTASLILGFTNQTAIVLGIALFFSSTIIILKTLSDNRETSRLYGQIAIGVILLDDVVATFALVVVAALATSGSLSFESIAVLLIKAIGLALGLFIVGGKIMPHFGKFFASSQELLFLFSIAWGLVIANAFHIAGFSYEVGALFAGVALAGLPYATEMAAKLKPLRDFFIVLFFVTLGETFSFGALQDSLVPAIVLSLVVMIGKPVFVMTSLGLLGYTRLTNFKAAIHLSQISEFSIILVIFAANSSLIDKRAIAVITLVALITIGISTYLMKYSDALFKLLEKYLVVFERKDIKERKQRHALYPIILFGYHKGGHEFMRVFRDMRQRYLVVDYDPDIIEHLEEQGIRHAYGDATDEEFLEEINAGKAQLVVSMMTDFAANKVLLSYVNRFEPRTTFICHANHYDEAADLYRHGASYVMLPHFIGSERISSYIKQHGFNPAAFDSYREKHIITIGKKALNA
ncbi:cation:proton antiporter [Candidatus Saccharibacteria bacterium]|nr:cation:proton antiporter [Candidatus Saccharibacteria bacterium]